MPAGCDFICKNKDCQHYNTGFTITAPWPMAKIEMVISKLNTNIKSHLDLKEKLVSYKNEGRKFACIIFPNTDNLKTEAYRIQLWSPKANCVWAYEVPYDGDTSMSDILTSDILPKTCPQTGGELMTFNKVIKENIKCPYCNSELIQSRWFSKDI